jgi:hypothetical protein
MTGLTDRAVGNAAADFGKEVEAARQRWEESMLRQVEALRDEVRQRSPDVLAALCGGLYEPPGVVLPYWGRPVRLVWPELDPRFEDGTPCATFDQAMLLYYLRTADGFPMADRWIGFRELPDGGFYHLAYQRYSGDHVMRTFGDDPDSLHAAARAFDGVRLTGIGEYAYAFLPLPRIRLAAVLWPGDEEFPGRGSVLFDASASHYMTTDGLGLLGGGLAGRLAKARPRPTA